MATASWNWIEALCCSLLSSVLHFYLLEEPLFDEHLPLVGEYLRCHIKYVPGVVWQRGE